MIRSRFVFLFAAVLLLQDCSKQGPVIDAGSPGFEPKGIQLFYQGKPFTGILRSQIPALDQGELAEYHAGLQHGITREQTLDGKLIAERPYYAGAKHGIHKTWHENGQMKTFVEFKYGKYAGEAWSWYPSGKPFDYRKYNDQGELLLSRKWREDGQIYMNQVFQNGEAIGMPGSKLCDPAKNEKDQPASSNEKKEYAP